MNLVFRATFLDPDSNNVGCSCHFFDRSFFAENIAIRVFLDTLFAGPNNETLYLMGFIKNRSIWISFYWCCERHQVFHSFLV